MRTRGVEPRELLYFSQDIPNKGSSAPCTSPLVTILLKFCK
jgi:hypothetical protein